MLGDQVDNVKDVSELLTGWGTKNGEVRGVEEELL